MTYEKLDTNWVNTMGAARHFKWRACNCSALPRTNLVARNYVDGRGNIPRMRNSAYAEKFP